MDFSNLTGTDIVVILIILIETIVLSVFIFLSLKEKKKITDVSLKNMDYVVYPILTFTGNKRATVEDQTFQTPFGPVFVSADEERIQADKTSAVLLQIQNGPKAFTSDEGGALTLTVTNRTKHSLNIEGGNVVTTLSKNRSAPVPKKVFHGGIAPVTVSANDNKNAILVVTGGNVTTDLSEAMYAVTLSSAVQAPPRQAINM